MCNDLMLQHIFIKNRHILRLTWLRKLFLLYIIRITQVLHYASFKRLFRRIKYRQSILRKPNEILK